MNFTATADAYDRFMGRYSVLLGPRLADFATVNAGERVLDVGCGPGALTAELVRRLGAGFVSAVDPSEDFVSAAQHRHPGVDVRLASAEQLPFADEAFDGALAQLVVHFMADPVLGLGEMARSLDDWAGTLTWIYAHARRSRGRATSREPGEDPEAGQGWLAHDPADDTGGAQALSPETV